MYTRADSEVVIDSKRVGKPLPLVEAWQNSSHVMLVYPDTICGSVTVKVGDPLTGLFKSKVKGTLHPVAGYWHFYIPKSAFANPGRCEYKIVSTDERGSRHVFGAGELRVFCGDTHDSSDGEGSDEAVDNAYINHNGAWYAVGVTYDDSGTPCFEVVGIAEPPKGVSGQAYAYNPSTGLFHAITVFLDEDGAVALEIEGTGVEGESTFAKGNDGFYHRIETEKDSSGVMCLTVGEKQ